MEPKPTYDVKPASIPDPDLRERWWLSFTPDHDLTAAAATFIERVQVPPVYLVRTPTMLLVGPLPTRLKVEPEPPIHAPAEAVLTVVQMPLL